MAYKRIVLATDGSATAETAEHVAATLAAATKGTLTIVHAYAEPTRAEPAVARALGIAERLDATLAQLALAWNVHQPGVTSAIAGSRDPGHVRANAGAGALKLDGGTLAEIDAILSRDPSPS